MTTIFSTKMFLIASDDCDLRNNFLVADGHYWREKFISITGNQFSAGEELSFDCWRSDEGNFSLPRGLYLNLDCIRGGLYLNLANNSDFLSLFTIDDNYNERGYICTFGDSIISEAITDAEWKL